MDTFSELKSKMSSYSNFDKASVITISAPCNGISEMKLRDHLIEIGTILEYDEDASIFIAAVNAGFGNRNPALIGLMLQGKTLYAAAYAKEGLIHQDTAQKALQKVLTLFPN